jgi:hypothetical protein
MPLTSWARVPIQFEMEKAFPHEANGEKKQRKHYAPEEKVAILRRHLREKEPISKLCDEMGLQPTVFYRWQKEFFENGAVRRAKDVPAVHVGPSTVFRLLFKKWQFSIAPFSRARVSIRTDGSKGGCRCTLDEHIVDGAPLQGRRRRGRNHQMRAPGLQL